MFTLFPPEKGGQVDFTKQFAFYNILENCNLILIGGITRLKSNIIQESKKKINLHFQYSGLC